MKNKKGFTLIELLAVIVILAIIALIAVPTIMNVLNKANKSAFKDTAYGIISAGELYFAEQQLELNGMGEDAEFTFPTDKIDIKGEVPAGTVLKVNKKGKIALAMSNGRYCVTKGYTDKDITITEGYTECNIPGDANAVKTLADLAVVSATLGVDSVNPCAQKEQVCEIDEDGTAFAIKVNEEDIYKFYVIADNGSEVTLIMASNLYAEGNTTEPDVAWLSYADYVAAGGDPDGWESDYYTANNSKGPITALKALKERTANWTNLEEYSYELNYGIGTYSGEYVQNVKARLPHYTDVIAEEVGCTLDGTSCPDWLYKGLKGTGDDNTKGFWLSTTTSGEIECADVVYSDGSLEGYSVPVDMTTYSGVRPVITLTK